MVVGVGLGLAVICAGAPAIPVGDGDVSADVAVSAPVVRGVLLAFEVQVSAYVGDDFVRAGLCAFERGVAAALYGEV